MAARMACSASFSGIITGLEQGMVIGGYVIGGEASR
jgi:hypothetical protein